MCIVCYSVRIVCMYVSIIIEGTRICIDKVLEIALAKIVQYLGFIQNW